MYCIISLSAQIYYTLLGANAIPCANGLFANNVYALHIISVHSRRQKLIICTTVVFLQEVLLFLFLVHVNSKAKQRSS